MRGQRGIKLFACLLAGFLLCVMVTMMYIGGKVNFREFTSAGQVYDLPAKQLQKSGKNMIYDAQTGKFQIQGNRTVRKYLLDGSMHAWKCVYITIDEMSTESMEAGIVYLDRNKKKIAELPVVLVSGENIIFLEENIPFYALGLRIYNAKDQSFSLKSIQLRDQVSGFLPWRIVKILSISYGGFLAVFFVILFWQKRRRKKSKMSEKRQTAESGGGNVLSCLQYAYRLLIEDGGKRASNRMDLRKKSLIRKILFALLFLWIALANINGWFLKGTSWKYTLLVCCLFLWMIAMFCWEGSRWAINRENLLDISWLRPMDWRSPLALSWLGLWVLTMISDVTANTRIHFAGYVMVFACGLLIYVWNNMESPRMLLFEMMNALEMDFVLAVVYCMVYRTKKLAVQYNGVFRSSEEFSAYALLMLGVFLVELDGLYAVKKRWFWYFAHMTGAGISMFFVVRAGNKTGYVAAVLLVLCFLFRMLLRSRKLRRGKGKLYFKYASAAALAFCVVGVVHLSTKYLPAYLDLEVEYQKETLLTSVPEEMMEAFDALEPGLMEDVVQEDSIEIPVYQKAYLRSLSLTGKGEPVRVFRKKVPAYSGYLQMAYRYGIFILVPYVVLLLCMLGKGFKSLRDVSRTGKSGGLWILFLTITFICFSVRGNLEYIQISPLWFCFYLGAGYWFTQQKE